MPLGRLPRSASTAQGTRRAGGLARDSETLSEDGIPIIGVALGKMIAVVSEVKNQYG